MEKGQRTTKNKTLNPYKITPNALYSFSKHILRKRRKNKEIKLAKSKKNIHKHLHNNIYLN